MNVRGYIKLPKSLLKIIWGLGLLCICFALVSAVHYKREVSIIQTIVEFENPSPREHMMTVEDGYNILTEYFGNTLENVPVRHIETDLIEDLVENHDYVLNASVYMDKIGVLHIDILEKEPVVRVFDRDISYYLDSYGNKLRLSESYTARVPLVMGKLPAGEDSVSWEDLAGFILRLKSDDFMNALVDQLIITAEGEYIIIPVLGDNRIYFGNEDEYERKVSYLKLFYSDAVRREGWKRCAGIDLRFKGQVVCRKNSRT